MTSSFARWAAVILFALAAVSARGAVSPWQAADAEALTIPEAGRWVHPNKSRAYRLDTAALREQLNRAPREFTPAAAQAPAEVSLPMPDGTLARFTVCESPIMAPELAAKYPEIKTWCGQGIDDPAASVRLDFTPSGFHAQILSPSGAVYIDPARRGDSVLHLSYHKRDLARDRNGFACLTPDDGAVLFQPAAGTIRSGASLRTYRLAVSATGEYTQFHGGTVAQGLAAIVTAINRVDGIYETELAIRLVLVANNDLLVFTNPSTDPFSNANASALLTQNQSITDQRIGNANYDVGHVFSTGGGGLSSVAIVCLDGSKARSETGLPSPTGDAFYVDFVAHEIGHEFGAHHSYNGIAGNCGGQRTASTAYEPGSGSTIMCYAGICATDDLQPHSDPFFHFISVAEIQFYTTVGFGGDCAVVTATGNSAPSIEAGANYVIPSRTPFALTAFGTDPNGHPITYCWEERDLGPAQNLGAADNGSSPRFRSFPPTVGPVRTFPRLSDLLNNSLTAGEALPTTSRTMNFRVTARDNRVGGGGVTTDDMAVTVVGTAGPFRVTSPNTPVVWSGFRTVTWDVAGTTASPINAASVTILLSTNGGVTFPVALATTTANDGSESVLLPNISTSQARIRVQAAGNIFFDISDSNFTIATYVPAPQVAFDGTIGRSAFLHEEGRAGRNGDGQPCAAEHRNRGHEQCRRHAECRRRRHPAQRPAKLRRPDGRRRGGGQAVYVPMHLALRRQRGGGAPDSERPLRAARRDEQFCDRRICPRDEFFRQRFFHFHPLAQRRHAVSFHAERVRPGRRHHQSHSHAEQFFTHLHRRRGCAAGRAGRPVRAAHVRRGRPLFVSQSDAHLR
ncbi:MAG TPA: zinc-dependent metalloprotease family protein [Verrucomicrobiae bacterium]|nr:zinc-dependent metalloprotease family protein [Verrucomicrobiae bacterium]